MKQKKPHTQQAGDFPSFLSYRKKLKSGQPNPKSEGHQNEGYESLNVESNPATNEPIVNNNQGEISPDRRLQAVSTQGPDVYIETVREADPNSNQMSAVSHPTYMYAGHYQTSFERDDGTGYAEINEREMRATSDATQYEDVEEREPIAVSRASQATSLSYAMPYHFEMENQNETPTIPNSARPLDGYIEAAGTQGSDGYLEPVGTQGTDGYLEPEGTQGSDGYLEPVGTQGSDGYLEPVGMQGSDGYLKPVGTQGSHGYIEILPGSDPDSDEFSRVPHVTSIHHGHYQPRSERSDDIEYEDINEREMRALSGASDSTSVSLYPEPYQHVSEADPDSNQTSAVSQVSSLYDARYQPRSEISDGTEYTQINEREMRAVSGGSQATSLSYAEPYEFRRAGRKKWKIQKID